MWCFPITFLWSLLPFIAAIRFTDFRTSRALVGGKSRSDESDTYKLKPPILRDEYLLEKSFIQKNYLPFQNQNTLNQPLPNIHWQSTGVPAVQPQPDINWQPHHIQKSQWQPQQNQLVPNAQWQPQQQLVPNAQWQPQQQLVPNAQWQPQQQLVPNAQWQPQQQLVPNAQWQPQQQLVPNAQWQPQLQLIPNSQWRGQPHGISATLPSRQPRAYQLLFPATHQIFLSQPIPLVLYQGASSSITASPPPGKLKCCRIPQSTDYISYTYCITRQECGVFGGSIAVVNSQVIHSAESCPSTDSCNTQYVVSPSVQTSSILTAKQHLRDTEAKIDEKAAALAKTRQELVDFRDKQAQWAQNVKASLAHEQSLMKKDIDDKRQLLQQEVENFQLALQQNNAKQGHQGANTLENIKQSNPNGSESSRNSKDTRIVNQAIRGSQQSAPRHVSNIEKAQREAAAALNRYHSGSKNSIRFLDQDEDEDPHAIHRPLDPAVKPVWVTEK